MKTPWTRADDNRAYKMGWILDRGAGRILAFDDTFKSDAEAIEYVVAKVAYGRPSSMDFKTCRKAIFLCCRGGAR